MTTEERAMRDDVIRVQSNLIVACELLRDVINRQYVHEVREACELYDEELDNICRALRVKVKRIADNLQFGSVGPPSESVIEPATGFGTEDTAAG